MSLAFQICSQTNKTYRYDELRPLVRRISSGLVRAGLRKDDVVFVCMNGCVEFVPLVLGIIASGGIVTSCNPQFTKGNDVNYPPYFFI